MVEQVVEIVEVRVGRAHGFAERARVGRLAGEQALVHALAQHGRGDVLPHALVQPGDDAADLRSLHRGARQHGGELDGFLEELGDRSAVDEHRAAPGLDRHGDLARGVEIDEFIAAIPGVLADELVGDALLAEEQADLAGEGA